MENELFNNYNIYRLLEKDASYCIDGIWDSILNGKKKKIQRKAYEAAARIYYHQGVTDTLKSMQPDFNSCTVLTENEKALLFKLLDKLDIQFYYIEPQGRIPKGCHPGLNILKRL